MLRGAFLSTSTLLVLQLLAASAILAAIAFFPPPRGTMILVPLWPGAEQGMTARAVDAGAVLVDRGPLPGSLVISGDRAAIAPGMLAHGVLILTGPKAGCGVPA
jgi:hypothetical protein